MATAENNILKIKRTIKALEKNNITCFFAKDHEDAKNIVKTLVKEGSVISCGGAMSLKDSGVLELMQGGKYNFLDRAKAKTPEEIRKVYLDTFDCDAFFTSANGITEEGELYNVDGNANRIAAIAFGPKKVIVVAGVNKIVRNLEEAVYRVKTVAAPCNGVRLNTETPCALTGKCSHVNGKMTDGCNCANRMCAYYQVSGFQRINGRINVIFLNEELGY